MGGHRGLPLVGTESIKNLARKEPLPSLQTRPNFRIILYWKRNLISGSLFDWKMLWGSDGKGIRKISTWLDVHPHSTRRPVGARAWLTGSAFVGPPGQSPPA